MEKMKAWVYRSRSEPADFLIDLEEVPVPAVGPGELLIRILKVSVCGTDEMLFAGKLNRAWEGIIPGHELCGEIVEVGPGSEGFKAGEIVAVESHYSVPGAVDEGVIGLWPPRDSERNDLKPYHGGYAQYACIPAACAYRIPMELTDGDFWPSLFEPAGNDYLLAKEAVQKARPRSVGVFGCGPHGLYVQVFLRHFGVEQVIAFEIDPVRTEFARELGCADHILDPTDANLREQVRDLLGGSLFDVTLDMVGKTGDALATCRQLTRASGWVFLFGLFNSDFQIGGEVANDLIFSRREMQIEENGTSHNLLGVTGREGIWGDLIQAVAGSRELQRQIMSPVEVIGTLDQLGEHIRHRPANVLKAALYPFS